jgi:hypothetical protein
MHIWVDTFVYEQLKEYGCYEDLYAVPSETYADMSPHLQIMLKDEDKREPTGLLCMRGSRLGQRRRDWGFFGHNRAKYQYEYNVADKIADRMEYMHLKTGQTVFHIRIKDRWKINVGYHHLTTKAFINALRPHVEGKKTLTVDDWHSGLMSFMLVKNTDDRERMETAHRLFESAHKQYLIDNIGVNTNDSSYPYI